MERTGSEKRVRDLHASVEELLARVTHLEEKATALEKKKKNGKLTNAERNAVERDMKDVRAQTEEAKKELVKFLVSCEEMMSSELA